MTTIRLPPGRRGAIAAALLALALVFAQSTALAHGYSHLRLSAEARPGPAAASQTCTECLSFAPVLAAAGGTGYSLNVAQGAVGNTYRTPIPPLTGLSPRHAFLSRAPPASA